MSQQFQNALAHLKIKIVKYDPTKQRPVSTNTIGTLAVDKFCQKVLTALGADALQFPDVYSACHDTSKMTEMLEEHAKETGVLKGDKVVVIPEKYAGLTLNLDESHQGRELKFFMTTPDEIVSTTAGTVYLKACKIPEDEAVAMARKVVPEYLPRSSAGVSSQKSVTGEEIAVFNNYIPPSWMTYEGDLPDELPPLFEKLVNHLFPIQEEREYFYSWLYCSLFTRAFVYLVLCGLGGIGKNRLKIILRALHGFTNAVDGKKSTISERFNAQLADNTLVWFDELHYDHDMENNLKEIQNDSISIERKNVDATRSTRIFASLVISNNKPRDNYIAFDARKFAPLSLNPARLDTSMSVDEISELTRKAEDWSSETYDIAFIAQIGRWIKKHGYSEKWPTLEYKGPMFYKLAHTSMSRWQKKAAAMVLETPPKVSGRVKFVEGKGFLWSAMEELAQKKNGDRAMQFPDFSTVKYFFDIFVDGEGRKAFETETISDSIMADFYVRVVNPEARIITEVEVNRAVTGKDSIEPEAGDLL